MSDRAIPRPSAQRSMLLTRSFSAFERSVASREWIKASLQAAALLWEIEQQEAAAAALPAAGRTVAC